MMSLIDLGSSFPEPLPDIVFILVRYRSDLTPLIMIFLKQLECSDRVGLK